MRSSKKWLAVYTKPRWEKKVFQILTNKGLEAYCPLNKVRKKWSDRVKVVEEPLFKSYVFVRVDEDERTSVRMSNGVVNFVYWLGKPAIINDNDINTIRRFLNEYQEVTAEPISLAAQQEVVVTAGALMDTRGTVIQVKGKKVEVLLEFINYKLVAYLDKQHLQVIQQATASK